MAVNIFQYSGKIFDCVKIIYVPTKDLLCLNCGTVDSCWKCIEKEYECR